MLLRKIRGIRDKIYNADTSPLECKKLLFSMAVTKGIGYVNESKSGMKLDFIDIRRAYFHSPARRRVYVILPDGDEEENM